MRAQSTERWTLAASVSSILSALVASACCIGPLVFALLGIGGAGLLVKFEPYRPYFAASTAALLGAGFYFTYRKPEPRVEDGPACDCELPRVNRAGRVMLWVAAVLSAAFLAFPHLASVIFA